MGAGWAIRGRQSPMVLSTAHRFIQEPRVKCTAGSRVDSALNSFGIAGGATEVTWGAARGYCSSLGEAVTGQQARVGPLLIMWIHIERNRNSFQNPSKNQTSIGS